jgi:hypothetical protein
MHFSVTHCIEAAISMYFVLPTRRERLEFQNGVEERPPCVSFLDVRDDYMCIEMQESRSNAEAGKRHGRCEM